MEKRQNDRVQKDKNCPKQGYENDVAVVMVPYPPQGHAIQLLHLSRRMLPYNIPIHFFGSTIHNRQVKTRIHGWNPSGVNNFHFHDFELPPLDSPPPNPDDKIRFPSHLQPLFEASFHLTEPLSVFIRDLSAKAKKVVIIYDAFMASVVQDVALIPNVEAYTFHVISAFAVYCFIWEVLGRPANCGVPQDLPLDEGCITSEFLDFGRSQYGCTQFSSGNIFNTSKLIEPSFIDSLAKEKLGGTDKVYALGPFIPVTIKDSPHQQHYSLQWLDNQEKNSVIYVSFGTTTTFSAFEIKELAIGLEQSNQKFIWVLRDADKCNVFEEGETRRIELPEGYEERVKDRGIIVRDWAPQLEILGHESTGGFMSHCAWNSCIESLTTGVPIAAWPMHSEQPRQAVLIAKVLKCGILVKEWGGKYESIKSSLVENAVRKLMASEEGECIRKRSNELGDAIKHSVEDKDGISSLELDAFMAHITR